MVLPVPSPPPGTRIIFCLLSSPLARTPCAPAAASLRKMALQSSSGLPHVSSRFVEYQDFQMPLSATLPCACPGKLLLPSASSSRSTLHHSVNGYRTHDSLCHDIWYHIVFAVDLSIIPTHLAALPPVKCHSPCALSPRLPPSFSALFAHPALLSACRVLSAGCPS